MIDKLLQEEIFLVSYDGIIPHVRTARIGTARELSLPHDAFYNAIEEQQITNWQLPKSPHSQILAISQLQPFHVLELWHH